MITLYGANASPFVRKVMAVLAIKKLPYEHIPSMPFSGDPELARVSPLQKVPALIDGELDIADSKVICRYLESAYPEVPVYPTDPQTRARADWLEEYGGTVLAEAAAGIFFRFMVPNVFKRPVNEDAVNDIIEKKLPPLLDYLEGQVPAHGFIFGDFTVADLALGSPFVKRQEYAGYTIDADTWPKFAALVERVKTHDAVSPLLKAEAAAFGS